MMAIPIDAVKGDYVIVFKPEVIQHIEWGGDPDNAIQFEADQKNYHPRNSFEIWKQTVKETSAPWLQEEITMAESLRSLLFEFSSRYLYN